MDFGYGYLTIHLFLLWTIERAVVLPDNMKIGFNGSFPFNLTRTS